MLHGDAHGGNLLPTPAGWRWIDLVETCRGPRAWDLAVLAGSESAGGGADSEDGRVALAAYASASGHPAPDPGRLAPFTRARELEAAVWLLGLAHQYPGRYREAAGASLARLLASGGPAA